VAAAAAFQAALAQLKVAISWQDKANAAWSAAAEDAYKALHPGWEVWHIAGDLKNAFEEGVKAVYDEARTAQALAEFGVLEAKAIGLEALSDTERGLATLAAAAARGAVLATDLASRVADTATHDAELMSEIASQDEAVADQDDAAVEQLGKAYATSLKHKLVLVAKIAVACRPPSRWPRSSEPAARARSPTSPSTPPKTPPKAPPKKLAGTSPRTPEKMPPTRVAG
jgi:hypothetical protein